MKTRRNCQWCRYQRCLAVGMKPSWVLSSDERERRFRKNRDKKQQKKESGGVSPPPQSPGQAVVLPNLPHQLLTVKTDLFPVSTTGNSLGTMSSSAPQFATIQMIPGGSRPQLLPHTGVIVRQFPRFPAAPVQGTLPPVDLRVKLETTSHLLEPAEPVVEVSSDQKLSPLPSPPPLTLFVSEGRNFNHRWLPNHYLHAYTCHLNLH